MRRALALCLALAALAACSSKEKATDAEPGTTATPTTAALASSASTPGSSAAPGTSASAPAPGTSAAPGTSNAPSTGTGASPAATRAATPTSTPPGTYTYDASGTQTILGSTSDVDGTSTLDVTPVSNGTQTSTQDNSQGKTTQTVVMRSTGMFLADLKITSPAFSKEFQLSPPVLLFPVPAPVGKSWTWSGTSTDGKTTVTATNKVVRTENLTIGGEKVQTVVLRTHLAITGDVDYTADVTTWVAPSLRLPVKDHTVGKGSTGLGRFSFDVTDVMRSVHPA
jgi:hypothetical protein